MITLHPFQNDAILRVRAERGQGKRIIVLVSPTGSGKTTMAADMVRRAVERESRVLFMAHRRKLVDQISSRLYQFDIHHGIIMRGERYSSSKVQVASRDTLTSRCFDHDWNGLPPADLVIVDEGHRSAKEDSEYRKILAMYPKATVVLLTATPVGPDGRGLGPWAEAMVCAAPTSQLVQDGHLVPVKCYAPDRKIVRGKAAKGIAGDLVASWKEYAEGMPTVLFCSRVEHSRDAVKAFQDAGIPFAHVDADTPDDDRDRIFERVANGDLKGVSNVGIMTEGVDVPALGCCQLYCECGGRVRFLQAVGRIMRPYPGKTHGVLIDHSGAVFTHGFPDEDTVWTLEGDVDSNFKKDHDDGKTAKANYCKACKLVYHGTLACPQCGKMPTKPPKSLFAPPPQETSDEILVAVDRDHKSPWTRDEKVKHWLRCLGVAANRNGTFGMASGIYKKKYGDWPDGDFPSMPERWEWKNKVADRYPNFVRRKVHQ